MGAYRVLLRAYPSSHRREFGELMEQAYNDRLRDIGRGAAFREATVDTVVSAPREHTATFTSFVRRQPGGWGFVAMIAVTLVGALLPMTGVGPVIAIALAASLASLTAGVLRSYRDSTVALVGLAMAALGLAVQAFGFLVPAFMEYQDSTPLAIGIETSLAGMALIAFAVAARSERVGLLVIAGLGLPFVGIFLWPILDALGAPGDSFVSGIFVAMGLLALALLRATPKQVAA